jgi:ketosteroid isomerase-like protein
MFFGLVEGRPFPREKSMRLTSLAAAASTLALVACMKPAETPEQAAARNQATTDSVHTYVMANAPRYAANVVSGNTDSILQWYASDAMMMAPNMPAARGHDAIKQLLTGMISAAPMTKMEIRPTDVTASGDLAVERGTFTLAVKPAGAPAAMADSGNYLIHWHRDGNTWKIKEHIWVSSNPPMAMPAAPARH